MGSNCNTKISIKNMLIIFFDFNCCKYKAYSVKRLLVKID